MSAPAGAPQQAPKKPIYKRIWFWVLAAILAVILIQAVSGGGDPASTTATDSGDSAPAGQPAPPVQEDTATAVAAGETVTLDDVQVTTTPLEATEVFGTKVLCTTATMVNGGDDAVSFAEGLDWKLQDPAGASRNSTVSENGIGTGELAPGGTASGQVCFEDAGAAGTYQVVYSPFASFTSDQATWENAR